MKIEIYDLRMIRDHIADSQFTYNEVQTIGYVNCLFNVVDYLILCCNIFVTTCFFLRVWHCFVDCSSCLAMFC